MSKWSRAVVLSGALVAAGACSSSGDGDSQQIDEDSLVPADTDAVGTSGRDEVEAGDVDAPEGADAGELDGDHTSDRDRAILTAEVFEAFDDESPGCGVGVVHDGASLTWAFGMSDLDTGVPLAADAIFDIGSVSKQFTAGAIAALVLEGELDLESDVSDVLDLEPFGADVSVADLVHHTSGLPDYIDLLDAEDDEVTTMDDALAIVAADDFGPEFDPGTAFEYSNTNYILLSAIVEEVSGSTLADFSAERIFAPLEMSDSTVRDDQGDLLPHQAQGYIADDGGWAPVGSSWRQTGDGAVHASIPDLLKWAQLFMHDDAAAADDGVLGSVEWRELMLQGGDIDDGDAVYAFGIGVEDGGDELSHAGSWIGYSSVLTIRPADGIAVAISCNIDGLAADTLGDAVLDIWSG